MNYCVVSPCGNRIDRYGGSPDPESCVPLAAGERLFVGDYTTATHYVRRFRLKAYTPAQAARKAQPPAHPARWCDRRMEWVDARPLEQVRADQWAAIKRRRDELEAAGFDVEGIGRFDSDGPARARLQLELLAAQAGGAGYRAEWTLADNTVVKLDAAAMVRVGLALHAHTARVHAAARAARQQLAKAKTIKAVVAIGLQVG